MNRSYTKLGIYYIVKKVVNSEEIRFHQKKRVKEKGRASKPSMRPYRPGSLWMGMLF